MSREEYWTGDPMAAWDYVKADRIRQERANDSAWLQGRYVYDAIGAFTECFTSFGRKGRINIAPYVKEPYPLTKEEIKTRDKKEAETRISRIQKMLNASVRKGMKSDGSHS